MASFATITVPAAYGFVIVAAGVGPFITNMYLGGAVMSARKKCNIQYPNAYGVPGYHEKADEFNRAQRSHQNYHEIIDQYVAMTLLGGLKHPIACAAGSILYFVGSVLYQKGYMDTSLDVETARYKKGAAIKWIGMLISLYSTVALAYDVITA